jgi:hypothetical protein
VNDKQAARDLAQRAGTSIPVGIQLEFWSLNILICLLERIEKLEEQARKSGDAVP